MALMEIEPEETKDGVVVVEKAELDVDVQVGEGGQSNAAHVVLVGLAGNGGSSTSGVSRVSLLSEMEETERGKGTKLKNKIKPLKKINMHTNKIVLPGTECLVSASVSNKDVEVDCSEEPWGV